MLRNDPLRNPEPLIEQVYRYVAARIGDGPHAEDVTSDVFERAVRYRGRYDARKGEPIAWLIGIARHCLADAYDARPVPLQESRPAATAHDELEQQTLHRMAMAAALRKLSPRDRDLIALRFGADLSARRIGEILDADTHAVETALSRALGRLRAHLTEPAAADNERTAL